MHQTPLQNLFYYLRDLYRSGSEAYYEFADEPGNPKTEGADYWTWADWEDLAGRAEKEGLQGFQLRRDEQLLRLRRQDLPLSPFPPADIYEWFDIDRLSFPPRIRLRDQTERREQWADDPARPKAWQEYAATLDANPSATPPESLRDWLENTPHHQGRRPKKTRSFNLSFSDQSKELQNRCRNFVLEFETYYQKHKTALQINRLYEALHTIYYELKNREDKKLYLSFGLVCGRLGGRPYANHLFHVPLKLRLSKHEFLLETDTFASRILCEEHFSELLSEHFRGEGSPHAAEQRKTAVLDAVDAFARQSHEFSFDSEWLRSEYYPTAMEMLSVFPDKHLAFFDENGQADTRFSDLPFEGLPTLRFAPVIQTKMVASGMDVARDAQNIARKIDELQALGRLDAVPDFFKKLFFVEQNQTLRPTGLSAPSADASDFLFPLPYNEEQLEIAKRLSAQEAVTVKGPPGTGKSHTIANLIAHFVAQGKSVLVVSHNAKALSVIKDKLPESIRDLAVSLVQETGGNEALKQSVQSIIRHLAQPYTEQEAQRLHEQRLALILRYKQTLQAVYESIQANARRLELPHPETGEPQNLTAAQWAQFLALERAAQNPTSEEPQLLDRIAHTADLEPVQERLSRMVLQANALRPEQFELLPFDFPPEKTLPDPLRLRELLANRQRLLAALDRKAYAQCDPECFDAPLLSALDNVQKLWQDWGKNASVRAFLNCKNVNFELLSTVSKQFHEKANRCTALQTELVHYAIDWGTVLQGVEPEEAMMRLEKLLEKFGTDNTLGAIKRQTLAWFQKDLFVFFNAKINGTPIQTADRLRILQKDLLYRQLRRQTEISLSQLFQMHGLAAPPDAEDAQEALQAVLELHAAIAELNALSARRNLPVLQPGKEPESMLTYLRGGFAYAEYQNIERELSELSRLPVQNAHPALHVLIRALKQNDAQAYERDLTVYSNLRRSYAQVRELEELFAELSALLPATVLRIRERALRGEKTVLDQRRFRYEVFLMQVDDFLKGVERQTARTERLSAKLQILQRNIEAKTAELVAYKAWLHKAQSVSDEQKSALNAWLNDLVNIGKGTGKNAARNRASAVRNMRFAKNAVSIWIMQQASALTFFSDTDPQQFDLLVIDEASQCDASSLNLLFRCKRALIVGDENQTSVVNRLRIDRVNELLDKYLHAHRFKTQFDVSNKNNSIYALSSVLYPNIVALREHFRCLPEIIGFSNTYVYGGAIVPLKTATEPEWGAPLELHRFDQDAFDESKPEMVRFVVERIRAYIQDFQSGKLRRLPTVGVLYLDASNKKHAKLLFKELLSQEDIKAHEEELELIIGTSREFQGDERDVVFLTVSASHSIAEDGKGIRPPRAVTGEEFMRIYNVAASRAKEKCLVLHSLHPDALALMNPDCFRKKLLDYCQGQGRERELGSADLQRLLLRTDARSGDFEPSVCRFLYEQGWGAYLQPQFEVGKYKLDFALLLPGRKLAIECDGSAFHDSPQQIRQDIDRQLVLERAGWRFFRIQSTDWFFNPDRERRRLLDWLGEMR